MSGINRKMDFSRTNSICPTPESALLSGVLENNVEVIKTLLRENPKLLLHEYPFPHEKPILLISCLENGVKPETVQALIEEGADLEVCVQWKALQWAAQNPNGEILEVIIRNLKAGQINECIEGNNALHALIKCDDVKHQEGSFVKNVELLLKAGINVNQGDGKNFSPILLAAKNGYELVIKTILEKSIAHVDLDTHKIRNKSARDLIREKSLYHRPLPEKVKYEYDLKERLLSCIRESKEDEFVDCLKTSELVNEDDSFSTLLQLSCERGLVKIVTCLIQKGADVNLTTNSNRKTPIELAAEGGHHKIFKVLLEQPHIFIPSKVLCYLIKNLSNFKSSEINHDECYKALLNKIRGNKLIVDINGEDGSSNTPIHYAIRYGGHSNAQELLKLGASLACKNDFGVMPVEDIEPELLENHLDDCIKFNVKNKNYEKQDFEVVFDYQSLVPPRRSKESSKFDEPDVETCSLPDDILPETEVISYMSRSSELKHLLKHPVIVSFLFMKWQKIRWLFYTNLSFYVLFVLSLLAYIFTYYGNFDDDEKSTFCVALMRLSWFLLNLTFLILILRECFQIFVSPVNYFQNFENLIEVILIIITGCILFTQSPSHDARKQLSSIAILLAAFELVLMVGQHPKLSTNVVMLKTVSVNFFKLLLWYSLLIIAFALSFNILFAKPEEQPKTNQTSAEEEKEDSFTGPGKSLFKTIVMLTGEFDAGSINFHTYPITSKLIFSLFIFMIVIILLNLLNGLAVSDTQTIKNDAELVGHIARAQHIRYVESMLLGNIIPTSLIKTLQNLCCCLPIDNSVNYAFIKPLAKKVCLFSNTQRCQLFVLPNNRGQIYLECRVNKKKRNGYFNFCVKPCSNTYLDKDTLWRTNIIIKRRREELEGDGKISMERLYAEQADLRKKLDEVLKILSQSTVEFK